MWCHYFVGNIIDMRYFSSCCDQYKSSCSNAYPFMLGLDEQFEKDCDSQDLVERLAAIHEPVTLEGCNQEEIREGKISLRNNSS